jgi:hypothetical protein
MLPRVTEQRIGRDPRAWAATRAAAVVVVGAVAAGTGALAPQHPGEGWRSVVLAVLGLAVVLFGVGWLVARRGAETPRALLAGRVVLLVSAVAAAGAGATEAALGSAPFGLGLVAVGLAVAVFAVLLPRFLAAPE